MLHYHLLHRHVTCASRLYECVIQVKNNCLYTFFVHFQRTQILDCLSRFDDVNAQVNCMVVVVVVSNDPQLQISLGRERQWSNKIH